MFLKPACLLLAFFASPLIADPLLERGYLEMYNLQFAEAHKTFGQFEQANPADPLGPVSDAAADLFSELDRLQILQSQFFVSNSGFLDFHRSPADPKLKEDFNANLDRTKRLSAAALQKSPGDFNARFASSLRSGLHAEYLALIEKKNLAALDEIKIGREEAQKVIAVQPQYYDAYIAGGIENYLLSLKPAPVRWFLGISGAQTDKQTGLKDLRIVAEQGHYLLPFARLLLAIAALRDGDRAQARNLLTWLSDHFPQNTLYQQELAKVK
jgi:hypothetical protein